jgi:hypothetical protein
MNRAIVFAVLACLAITTRAQSVDREAQFKRLESAYSSVFRESPPLFVEWLRTARSMNLQVPPQEWNDVESEIVQTLHRLQSTALRSWLGHVFEGLTDSELEHFATLMEDPVLVKASALAAAPKFQQELFVMAGSQAVTWPAEAIRTVLEKRGLKAPPYAR